MRAIGIGVDARRGARRGGRGRGRGDARATRMAIGRGARETSSSSSSTAARARAVTVETETGTGTGTTRARVRKLARARVEDFARVDKFASRGETTPLERAPRLSETLDSGAEIWIKRDDVYGTLTGGNKTRKLEFLMAEALEEGATMVVTQGATQSNHARQTAAACAKLGLKCHILLEDRTGRRDENYTRNGNVLLDDLFGATREYRPGDRGLNMNEEVEIVAKAYRARGERVYTIVGGGSCPTGALGYVRAAYEILDQAREMDLDIDHLVHATGSAGTQAGLAVGFHSVDADINLLGFGVRAPRDVQESNVYDLALRTCAKLGCPPIDRSKIVADSKYVGEGYGIPATSTVDAIRLFAETEGVLLDPVYSGKAAAGLIDYCLTGAFKPGEKIVFLHTGGATSLHGYLDAFARRPDA